MNDSSGAWSVDDDIPAAANCFAIEEEVEDSIAALVPLLLETYPEGGSFDLDVSTWSNDHLHKVVVLESGAAHFEPVA